MFRFRKKIFEKKLRNNNNNNNNVTMLIVSILFDQSKCFDFEKNFEKKIYIYIYIIEFLKKNYIIIIIIM